MDKRYQIFISSTYEDLKEEREQVIKATLEMGHIPVGMEMFNAADEEQWEIIKRTIDTSDYYIVIIAHRYGSIAPGEKISFTEKEYNYAKSKGLPCIGFIIRSDADWPANRVETGKAAKSVAAFKAKIKGRPVDFWSNKEELKSKFAIAMLKTFNIQPGIGWIRGSEAPSTSISEALAQATNDNAKLRDELASLRELREISLLKIILDISVNQTYEIDAYDRESQKMEAHFSLAYIFLRIANTIKFSEYSMSALEIQITRIIFGSKASPAIDYATFQTSEDDYEEVRLSNLPIHELKDLGLISVGGQDDGQTISLTDLGKEMWAYLFKNPPGDFRE